MSILIIGDDHNYEISRLYHSYGVYRTECWKNLECRLSLPEGIDAIVFLQDECNHCLISKYKKQAAEKEIAYVCIRNPRRARSEFIKHSEKWIASTASKC